MRTFLCERCKKIFYEETNRKRKICDNCKKPVIVKGYSKCPKFLRLAYLRATNNHCQVCKKQLQDDELEIHRIIRGNQGGKYTLAKLNSKENNVMVVCNPCHKLLHQKNLPLNNETEHI